MVFWPGTTGEVLKWKIIVVLPLLNATVFAAIPLTVKSLAWTVAVFTASLRLIMKSTGCVLITLSQPGSVMVTEQPVGVGVAVAVALAVGVDVAVAVGVNVAVAVGVGVGVPAGTRNA
jgi:hypothetical protein